MRIVVPATPDGLHPRTLPAILRSGFMAEVRPMLGVEAYYELMVELWDSMAAGGDDVAIVEHDIEVAEDTLVRFAACRSEWCAHSYEVYAGDVAAAYGGPFALGCVRFRASLAQRFPDAVKEAGKMDIHPVHPPRSYQVMDSTLTHWLRGPYATAGLPHPAPPVCHHRPNVVHHHRYVRVNTFPPYEAPRAQV